jgi:flagellar operon protein
MSTVLAIGAAASPPRPSGPAPATRGAVSFQKTLENALGGGVRFSSHALRRIEERHITLSADDRARIGEAMDRAAAKGARDALLLLDQVALVVSVPNRTVITALSGSELDGAVVTQIDSAVMVS